MRQLLVPLSAPEAADPDRFGPKAANLAALGQAGLPVPGGYALDAEAYRVQMRALGLEEHAREVFHTEGMEARRHALAIRLGLLDEPITEELVEPLLAVWREIVREGALGVIRSSSLVEDRFDSSFAGQFESFLGIEDEGEFLLAVRSCWCALWSTRALRYMATHDAADPADTAMALIIQPLVNAYASGGGLSRTAEGEITISATLGLGSAIAQGEVVPDRYRLTRGGEILETVGGRKTHAVGCAHGTQTMKKAVAEEPCLSPEQVVELAGYIVRAEEIVGGAAEIEWSLDDEGFKMLQARPLHIEDEVTDVGELWAQKPRLRGHPAGVGWGTGRACVVNCECEVSRIGPGDVLITKVAGPALSQMLGQVSAVVAELGGSTSHLASLARERGIPMVLGVLDATTSIPDGSTVAVDGVAGIVRWTTERS
ncbi:MAG TPA: PEP/pyruvate-binding domain-containing protein [Gammaproteobacteria bacterium]